MASSALLDSSGVIASVKGQETTDTSGGMSCLAITLKPEGTVKCSANELLDE